jgi:hypothetical protein
MSILHALDNPATYQGHNGDLTAILVILGLLLVLLLIGVGVSMATRPDKQIDEWGNPAQKPPAPPQ